MDEETHHRADPDDGHLTCVRCGTTVEGDAPPATWLCSMENGSRQYCCEACARTHIRAIEGRLDAD
ncbi:hypothetical protein [Streptomyces sp. NPDC049970]